MRVLPTFPAAVASVKTFISRTFLAYFSTHRFNAARTGSYDTLNRIFFISYWGYLYCLDKDGNLLWKYAIPSEIEGGHPCVLKYVFAPAQDLYCLDINGNLLWKFLCNCNHPFCGVSADGSFIYFSADNELKKLRYDGTLVASAPNSKRTPALTKESIFSCDDAYLRCFSYDLTQKWAVLVDTASPPEISSPSVADFIVTGSNMGIKAYEDDGNLRFARDYGQAQLPSIRNNTIYCEAYTYPDDFLVALTKNGAELWKADISGLDGNQGDISPACYNYIVARDGSIFSQDDGSLIAHISVNPYLYATHLAKDRFFIIDDTSIKCYDQDFNLLWSFAVDDISGCPAIV